MYIQISFGILYAMLSKAFFLSNQALQRTHQFGKAINYYKEAVKVNIIILNCQYYVIFRLSIFYIYIHIYNYIARMKKTTR